ncbi:MAG: hypothetical protein L0271_06775 [Gemmatimonadetes bacterium]|nr:hypothetical protein [Gemmatimonadota bacterium]
MKPTSLTLLAIPALALAACDSPTSPDAEAGLEFHAALVASVYYFNADVQGIINPDLAPSPATGRVQLELTDLRDGTYRAEWVGSISNPARETFTAGQIGIINPEIRPTSPAPGASLARLFSNASLSCSSLVLDSRGVIDPEVLPATVVSDMLRNPGRYEARLTTSVLTGGAIAAALYRTSTPASAPAKPVSGGVGCG